MITEEIKITKEISAFKRAFLRLSKNEQTYIVNALFYRTRRDDCNEIREEESVKKTCHQFAMYLMSDR